MKGRNQSRQRREGQMRREEPSLTVVEADGVQKGIPDSNGNVGLEGEDHLLILYQFKACAAHRIDYCVSNWLLYSLHSYLWKLINSDVQ